MDKNKLPRGFRINGDLSADSPYEPFGQWWYSLQVWETRTVGMWLWKHDETRWWHVDKSTKKEELVQTAWLMHEGKKS